MALALNVTCQNFSLTTSEDSVLRRQFRGLERRLVHFPEPVAEVGLTEHNGPRSIEVDLRIKLGPLGEHLISHQTGPRVYQAIKLAIVDVERELERRLAKERGEPTFGVPSRRRSS